MVSVVRIESPRAAAGLPPGIPRHDKEYRRAAPAAPPRRRRDGQFARKAFQSVKVVTFVVEKEG